MDPLSERLAEAGTRFGAVACYTDYGALLAAEQLDLVVIASPTAYHAQQTIAACEAGVDVFCDKPMALDLAACDRMIEAADRHGRKLMVYQPHRGRPETVALQSILERGLLGEVFMMKEARSGFSRRNDWQAWRRNGGGMLANYGAHYVDQLLHTSGSTATKISCSLRTVASLGDADDVVKAVIETESGIILDLDINMCVGIPPCPWMVFGKCGTAALDPATKSWRVRYYREEDLPERALQEGLAAQDRRYCAEPDMPWREEEVALADFQKVDYYAKCHDYFAKDMAPFVPISQTREVMRVLEQCRQDASQ